jgi:16S rRNA (guanine527-N7)-methyltransferase
LSARTPRGAGGDRARARSAGSARAALAGLPLEDAARERLATYLELLDAWSRRVNLSAARTHADRARVLIAPALAALPWIRPGRLLDVGAGSGSPGLVLALLRSEGPVTLLEPRLRRWAFLREAARACGGSSVEVLRQRHDQYAGPPAQTVTLRALKLPPAELVPLMAEGGRLLLFSTRPRNTAPFRPVAQTDDLLVLE